MIGAAGAVVVCAVLAAVRRHAPPLGIATVVLVAALVVRPLLDDGAWRHAGGFILLAGVAAVLLLLSVSISAGRRRR